MPCTRPNRRKAAIAPGDLRPTFGLSSDVKSTFHFGIERIYPAQTARSRRNAQPVRFRATRPAIVATRCAGLAELADATVSKTVVRKDVWVRVPHSALAFGVPCSRRALAGALVIVLGVQPPGPARRGFAPRTPRGGWLRWVGMVRFELNPWLGRRGTCRDSDRHGLSWGCSNWSLLWMALLRTAPHRTAPHRTERFGRILAVGSGTTRTLTVAASVPYDDMLARFAPLVASR